MAWRGIDLGEPQLRTSTLPGLQSQKQCKGCSRRLEGYRRMGSKERMNKTYQHHYSVIPLSRWGREWVEVFAGALASPTPPELVGKNIC